MPNRTQTTIMNRFINLFPSDGSLDISEAINLFSMVDAWMKFEAHYEPGTDINALVDYFCQTAGVKIGSCFVLAIHGMPAKAIEAVWNG